MIEKPEKSAKEERRERMHRRGEYASAQAQQTIFRDDALCINCFFTYGIVREFDEVHHFYGRGRDADDWREHHSSMGCLCRKCHNKFTPIKVKGTRPEQEKVLEQANEDPINLRWRR
jgi:hypothetical protein